MKPDYKLVAKAKYIHMTADLASELWHEVYKRYYPAKQLDALVETLQSADAIEEDIDRDVNYFLVFLGDKLIGYFAWKMENTALHLMHLYLKPEYRGKALGRDIVLSCERLARGEGKGRVWCTVHAKALLRQWGIEGDWVGIGHCILGYPAADPKPAAPRKPDYIVKV